jgi:hypothetical protein
MQPSKSDLQQVPGIGPRTASYLKSIGIQRVADLEGADPETLYRRLCRKHSRSLDRCLLYVLRCATYYASVPRPEPGLLKWWKWKD